MTRWTADQLAEYMASMAPCMPRGSTLLEDKADSGPESVLSRKIVKYCSEYGYPTFHDRSRGKNKAGWPDVTLCLSNGVVLFLELKSAKGVLRKEQAEIRQQMLFLGHHHYVIKSYKEFLGVIADMGEK